jgi:ATP adenylyltransferase
VKSWPIPPSATYQRLREYMAERMRMSHVHQPLMLMIFGRHSQSPAGNVTKIDDYTKRVKQMVGKVLTGNGITHCATGTYIIVGCEEPTDAERD